MEDSCLGELDAQLGYLGYACQDPAALFGQVCQACIWCELCEDADASPYSQN